MTFPVGWDQVQNAIKAAVVGTNAVVEKAVSWSSEGQPTAERRLILDIVYAQELQERDDFVVAEDGISTTWVHSTLYYIRVQVRAESHLNAPGKDGLFTLEKARVGLLRPALVFDAGLILQPDSSTYIHSLQFPSNGRTVSAFAFEMGFRAVVDSPLTDTVDAEPNMVQVAVFGEAEVGEDDPVELDQDVYRDGFPVEEEEEDP